MAMGAEAMRARHPVGAARRDLRYGFVMLTAAQVTGHLDAIARDGYTIVEDAIPSDLLDALAEDLERLEAVYEIVPSPNVFEGADTLRVYNLLALSHIWQDVPVYDHVLPIVEGVLDRGCL